MVSVETTCHQLDAFQYSNKVPNILNGPLSKVRSILDIKCAAYEDWKSQYYIDLYFGLVMESI